MKEALNNFYHSFIFKTDSRFNLEENENGNTLVINDADHGDQGNYVCSVSAYKRTELHHKLVIKGSFEFLQPQMTFYLPFTAEPPVLSVEPGQVLTLLEGSPALLSCRAEAPDNPQLRWRKCDGGPVVQEADNGLLSFDSVSRNHSGCYECQAEAVSLKAELIVECELNVEKN